MDEPQRIAVVGTGIGGLAAGWLLSRAGHHVTLLERAPRLGMAAHGVSLPTADGSGRVDVPVRAFNPALWPNLVALAEQLGLGSNAVSLASSYSDLEGATWLCFRDLRLGPDQAMPLPDQASLLRPAAARTVASLWSLRRRALDGDFDGQPLGSWLRAGGYSQHFIGQFVCPVLALMLSCPHDDVLGYPADVILAALPLLFGEVSFRRFAGGTLAVVRRIEQDLGEVRCGVDVQAVKDADGQVLVRSGGADEAFDHCVVATQANQAAALLQGWGEERDLLGRVHYASSEVVVHDDPRFMPRARARWSPVNFATRPDGSDSMGTIWVNRIEPLLQGGADVFQTWNPLFEPEPGRVSLRVKLQRPLVTDDSVAAVERLTSLQGQPGRRLWLVGSYAAEGIPLLESGVLSSMRVARLLGAPAPWAAAA